MATHSHDSHGNAEVETPEVPLRITVPQGVALLGYTLFAVVLGRVVDHATPVMLAALAAYLAPRSHGWKVRLPLAALPAAAVLFIIKSCVAEDSDAGVPTSVDREPDFSM